MMRLFACFIVYADYIKIVMCSVIIFIRFVALFRHYNVKPYPAVSEKLRLRMFSS